MFAKACLVDRATLQDAQAVGDIVAAEETLRTAFFTDVKPLLAQWRKGKNLEGDPLAAYRASGYEAKVAKEREAARAARPSAGGGSYA
jgi:L-rhamnose isomerase/sugar isomerase